MSLSYHTITTPRLTTAYLSAGTPGKPRLLLLHGNVSSAVFYEHLMERLADDFEMLAPDFRCFGHSSALPIDATRGMRDFSDDIAEFLHAVGWDRFHLFGWSMGGGVAMQYAIDHPRQVQSLILQAPLSPFGFGGSYGEAGAPVEPAGLGSGAACTNQALLQAIRTGDRTLPGQVIDSVYVAAGYKLPEAQREKYIDSILLCKTGDDMCQGDSIPCAQWPYAKSGGKGVSNTMSVQYCNLSALADVQPQMPIRQGCDGIRSQCLRCGGIGANGSSARLSRSGSIPLSTHGGTDAVCAGAVSRSWRPVRGAADLRQRPRLYVGSRGSGGGSAAAIYSLNTGGIHMLFEKTAIVTGAASGIGYAVAQALRQEGAQVVMADVNEALLIESARELGGVPFVGNLTRREDCRRLVEFTVERFGGVDILANVAGVQHVCPIEEFPEDKWDFIISLMLTAPFLLTRYCWPYMKEKGWGRIINMSSIHGLVASEFKSAYVSAKHGLVGFTKTAAMEGGPQGITCNAICPAYVMTPLVEKQIAAQAQTHGIPEEKVISDIMLSKAAIKKMVPAENIGAIVKFLCSDAAASITGIALPIDGGWTAN